MSQDDLTLSLTSSFLSVCRLFSLTRLPAAAPSSSAGNFFDPKLPKFLWKFKTRSPKYEARTSTEAEHQINPIRVKYSGNQARHVFIFSLSLKTEIPQLSGSATTSLPTFFIEQFFKVESQIFQFKLLFSRLIVKWFGGSLMFVSGRIGGSLKPRDKGKDRDSNLLRIISLLSGKREYEGERTRKKGNVG